MVIHFVLLSMTWILISKLCNNVIVLNEGQILMQGALWKQVRNDERVIDAYFGGGVI